MKNEAAIGYKARFRFLEFKQKGRLLGVLFAFIILKKKLFKKMSKKA